MLTDSRQSNLVDEFSAPWGHFELHGYLKVWLGLCHTIPGWPCLRRLALWFRSPLKTKLSGPVDVIVWGLKLRLWSKGNLSEQRLLLTPQFLDPKERLWLSNELKNGGVFLDVGTNIGVYSMWAASISKDVHVESFEPDSELCKRLISNLKRNKIENVHLNEFALGGECGEINLARGVNNLGENRLTVDALGAVPNLVVRVCTLSEIIHQKDIRQIDAMKIDVEGHEVAVLKPFFNQAPECSWPRSIICELDRRVESPTETEVGTLLLRNGYQLAQRTRMNGIFIKRAISRDV